MTVWPRKRETPPADPVAAARIETVFTGVPQTDQQLAERLEQAGEQVTDENLAELRRRVGPWLPAPRARPYRPVFRRRRASQHAALCGVVQQAETVRAALESAGRARAVAYVVQGYTPGQTVSLSGSDDSSADAAAIDTALRGNQAAAATRDTSVRLDYQDAITAWHQRKREAQQQMATLHQAASNLPHRERPAARMSEVWLEVAFDRLYYAHNDRDICALEDTAWQLLTAVPERRCPRSSPRRLAHHHRDWIRRQAGLHTDELNYLARVSQEFSSLPRAENGDG